MKKKILIALAILVAALYLYPSKKFTFEELYPHKDTVLSSLQVFRNEPTSDIKMGDFNWHYHVAGQGDTTILFLHGMGGSYDIWWQQINYFKNHYKIVSLTYPPVTHLTDLSKGILAILEKEKIQKVVIIGTSLGGYLSQYLAVNHPEKVMKVMLGNTFPPNTENKANNESLVKKMTWAPEWFVIKSIREKYNKEVIPASGNSPIANAFLNELLGKGVNRAVFIARYYCVVDTFTPKIASNIPLQIVESDNDPLVNKHLLDMLKTTYPQAKVINLHEKGHFPYLMDAQDYNKIIEEFLVTPSVFSTNL
jgi:maspardin